MPTYTFQCDACNFTTKRRMATPLPPPCPACQARMSQSVPAIQASFESDNGGSLGAQSYDYDIDRVIGDSVRKINQRYVDRQIGKHEILKNHPGKTREDLAKSAEGYYVMSEAERDFKKRQRDAVENIKRTVKPVSQ